ncbi:hypothetical protein AB9F38_37105, partial [Rhizobium leguminosarum]
QFAKQILTRAGMEADKSETTAAVLVEGDMIGHDTHGVRSGFVPTKGATRLAAGCETDSCTMRPRSVNCRMKAESAK